MPLLNEIMSYMPKRKEVSDWNAMFDRANSINDDGHACKLVRALAHGERICKSWEDSEKFRIKGAMWLQLGNMGMKSSCNPLCVYLNQVRLAIDSVEDSGELWVRSAGFDEAWEK